MIKKCIVDVFEKDFECKTCGKRFSGYETGFSRGHFIFNKDKRYIFIGDDIWYGFPNDTSFEVVPVMKKQGWILIHLCPFCQSSHKKEIKDIGITRLTCFDLEASCFEEEEGQWKLTVGTIEEVEE